MAEGEGLEPSSPKAPVFKTGGLPIILTLRWGVWAHPNPVYYTCIQMFFHFQKN